MINNYFNEITLVASKKELIFVDLDLANVLTIRRGLRITTNLSLDCVLVQYDAFTILDCINLVKISSVLESIMLDCIIIISNIKEVIAMFINWGQKASEPRICDSMEVSENAIR